MKTERNGRGGGERRLTDGLAYRHKHTSRTQHKTEVVFFLFLYGCIFFVDANDFRLQVKTSFFVFFLYNKHRKKKERCNLKKQSFYQGLSDYNDIFLLIDSHILCIDA